MISIQDHLAKLYAIWLREFKVFLRERSRLVASTFTPILWLFVIGSGLEDESEVPEAYFIPDSQLEQWTYLKGKKSEPRVHKGSGTAYHYEEGAIPFPDPTDQPSRTILTGEGGTTPSRFKHVVQTPERTTSPADACRARTIEWLPR